MNKIPIAILGTVTRKYKLKKVRRAKVIVTRR